MTSAQLVTAEWTCSRCGATNRRLVLSDANDADDRCVTCRLRHHLTKGDRPVRWDALAQP